jgi:hypothetical protein
MEFEDDVDLCILKVMLTWKWKMITTFLLMIMLISIGKMILTRVLKGYVGLQVENDVNLQKIYIEDKPGYLM